ncbi:MAG TPA: amino acid permease [Pirellulales bacterium]|jgi:APA family basic amino acid/polyamine antiporter
MLWKQLFRLKSIETLMADMAGEHQLRRVLGPISLTALGVGAIIGAGIFVMTGQVAAVDAGPAIILSFTFAAIGCALAALCYAEFAAMVPIAGSAYTYAYATLGEVFAWIIGWDLMLEYAMSCATVAASWTHYLNELLASVNMSRIPSYLISDPFTDRDAWFNLPGALVMLIVTIVLVRGIRESATTNAILVFVKLAVVLFVIAVGAFYVVPSNWTSVPVNERLLPEQVLVPDLAYTYALDVEKLPKEEAKARSQQLAQQTLALFKIEEARQDGARMLKEGIQTQAEVDAQVGAAIELHAGKIATAEKDVAATTKILAQLNEQAPAKAAEKWGMLGLLGLNHYLVPLDDATRSSFMPYGISGLMLGASLVFFAFIGFDAVSTQAEEARNPQRDMPIAIMASLVLCTVLYIAVSAIITGMVPYPAIDQHAAIASAFGELGEKEHSTGLRLASGLIAAGGLAGMTSVLLVTFLSQVRVFMAMSRDGLLPPIFSHVHPKYRSPHLATMLTGGVICVVAAFTPINDLTKMVNIGTLLAFIVVCAAVLLLRIQRPEVHRPFRCPVVYVVAPLGIVVNLTMMLFLPLSTWLRLVIWLAIGLAIYLLYSRFHSRLARDTMYEIKKHGMGGSDAPLAG